MKVIRITFVFFAVVLIEASKFHQSDYTIKPEIVEVVKYNQSYERNITAGLVYHNRTFRAVNASAYLLEDLSMNMKLEVQFYKFLSNEYRFFPITMTLDVCLDMFSDPFGIRESLEKSVNVNVTCPFKKGFYRMTYGMLNFSNFPPHIPPGRYKGTMALFDNFNFVLEFHIYGEVEERNWKFPF